MITTDRLTLRNLQPTDVPLLHASRNDPRCARYQRYEITTIPALEQFVRNYASCRFPSTAEEQHYGVALRQSGELIGDLSVFFTGADRCITLGITVYPAWQRQGFAREILRAVSLRLREDYPAMEQVALIDPDNAASLALFGSLGFLQECYAPSIHSCVLTLPATEATRP